MSAIGFNPVADQGNLNRVLTHIVVTDFPTLNVSAGYMAKSQAVLTPEGPFVEQIETATGVVNSPKPFVMATISISLLRSQSLANAWLTQSMSSATLGDITAYPDSDVLQPFQLTNCSIQDLEPGAFDGADPTYKVTVRGTLYINATMWAPITGASGIVTTLV